MIHITGETAEPRDIALFITLANGQDFNIYGDTDKRNVIYADKILSSNKPTIDNKAVSGSEFMYGGVYMGELSFGFICPDNFNRTSLYDAEVKVKYLCPDGTIFKGTFTITEATRNGNQIVVKAYDAMKKLDIPLVEDNKGSVFWLLSKISQHTGVPLGNTQAEIHALTNGSADIQYRMRKAELQSYREALSCLGAVTCTFATIDHNGYLRLCKFHTTSDVTIAPSQRYNSKISDFNIEYKSVTFTATNNKKYSKSNASNTAVLALDLGKLPIVYGNDTKCNQIAQNIANTLETVNYVPCELSITTDTAEGLELGDRIHLTEAGRTQHDVDTLCMAYKWTYGLAKSVKGLGSEPTRSATQSSSGSSTSTTTYDGGTGGVSMQTTTNEQAITVNGSTSEEVARFVAKTTSAVPVLITVTIPFTSSGSGMAAAVDYYVNNTRDTSATVEQEYSVNGKHYFTLTYYFTTTPNAEQTISLRMRGVSSDTLTIDARAVKGVMLCGGMDLEYVNDSEGGESEYTPGGEDSIPDGQVEVYVKGECNDSELYYLTLFEITEQLANGTHYSIAVDELYHYVTDTTDGIFRTTTSSVEGTASGYYITETVSYVPAIVQYKDYDNKDVVIIDECYTVTVNNYDVEIS